MIISGRRNGMNEKRTRESTFQLAAMGAKLRMSLNHCDSSRVERKSSLLAINSALAPSTSKASLGSSDFDADLGAGAAGPPVLPAFGPPALAPPPPLPASETPAQWVETVFSRRVQGQKPPFP